MSYVTSKCFKPTTVPVGCTFWGKIIIGGFSTLILDIPLIIRSHMETQLIVLVGHSSCASAAYRTLNDMKCLQVFSIKFQRNFVFCETTPEYYYYMQVMSRSNLTPLHPQNTKPLLLLLLLL